MESVKTNLEQNARLLKTKVSKYAILGLCISLITITIATLAVSYQMTGAVSLHGIIYAQKNNIALMILDLTPFLFMLWGQSVSSVMSYTAGAMVIDQTQALRDQTKELNSRVEYETSHDLLTNLPNRILFIDRLNQSISNLRGKNGMLAVVMINIDNFKELNNGFGNYNADRLLKQFAQRLKYSIDEPATIARFTGDEFAVLLPHINKIDEVLQYVNKLKKSLSISFTLESLTLDISASMGIALYPEHGQDQDTLLQRSNLALYNAKQANKPFSIYEQSMDKKSPNKLILMSELKRAIDSDQLIIKFQPKIDMTTNKICSCEALLCWQHPTFGLMDSDKFIPAAERTGLIKDLTQFVLKQSIAYASQWYKRGKDIGVSINLSALDMMDVELPFTIESLLNVFDFPASLLTLEIIESYHLTDNDRVIEVIKRLSAQGIQISLDEFGTGFSSFMYLIMLPINELKIDKSFITKIEEDEKIKNIVRSIVQLGNTTDITVVAGGIENKEQFDLLKSMGCQRGQGYFFSKPLDFQQFEEFIIQSEALPTEKTQSVKPFHVIKNNNNH